MSSAWTIPATLIWLRYLLKTHKTNIIPVGWRIWYTYIQVPSIQSFDHTRYLVHRENLLAWIRMKIVRISCEFYAWKRDEKQANEYRTKKTHNIYAKFTRFHAIFIRSSCEIIFTWFSCVKWFSLIYHSIHHVIIALFRFQ